MKFNKIEESLNELDRATNNCYDLRSLYEMLNEPSDKVTELLKQNIDAKYIYEALTDENDEDEWDYNNEFWIDYKERQLKKKGKKNWDEDDWDAYNYIQNVRAESDYYNRYDEALSNEEEVNLPPDAKYVFEIREQDDELNDKEVLATIEVPFEEVEKSEDKKFPKNAKWASMWALKASHIAEEKFDNKDNKIIGVVIMHDPIREASMSQFLGKKLLPKKEDCKKEESIHRVVRQSITEGCFVEEVAPADYEPTKKGIAYKVFKVKNGKLYPPMVANAGGADTPVGVWLKAEEGEFAGLSKTGRPQVKSTGSGNLSYRPGWHLGDIPRASQFDRTNKETGEKEFPKDFVWAECEYAMDVDYQKDSDEQGYMRTRADGTTYRSDKYQHSLAGLPRLPKDGYYRYRTNPRPDTVPWVITGAIKVKKLLDDAEVNEILKKNGIEPIHRQGGDKTLAELGLKQITESVTESVEYDLEPRRRTAVDGKKYWVAFDKNTQKYATITAIGKYDTKKECQQAIDKFTGNTSSEESLKEEYGNYYGHPVCEEIADALDNGNTRGDTNDYGTWELELPNVNLDELSAESIDFITHEISYPVRDGHLSYNGLDVVYETGVGFTLTEDDIKALGLEEHNGYFENWLDYSINIEDEGKLDGDEDDGEEIDESLNAQPEKIEEGKDVTNIKFDEMVNLLKKAYNFGREGFEKGYKVGGAYNPEFLEWKSSEDVEGFSRLSVRMFAEYNKGWVDAQTDKLIADGAIVEPLN